MINSGEANIVVGTHALLSKINFKELGLLIIDEDQHFGVSQKKNKNPLEVMYMFYL